MNEFIVQFQRLVEIYERQGQRFGQACFNALYELDPEVANMIRGTDADPFYATVLDSTRIAKFFVEVFGA